jgi:hypothetical protein
MIEVIDRLAAVRARVIAMARDLPEIAPEQGGRTLSVVPSTEHHTRK